MAMQTDVVAKHLNASGLVVTGRCRVKGYQIAPGGAGQIVFYDNTTNSGAQRLIFDTTVNTAIIATIIPGEGILFVNGVYIVLPGTASITVFYG